jgi:phage shock protein A
LVARLKDEIAAQAALLKQGELRQQQLERSEAKAKGLEEQVAKLTSLLAESKAEMKTLSMRLAASRTAEANAKVPGSAIKTGAASRGMSAPSEAVQNALAKEDLYGDLTGLIVRAVKRNDTEDTFDCIQTGRNGSTSCFRISQANDPVTYGIC